MTEWSTNWGWSRDWCQPGRKERAVWCGDLSRCMVSTAQGTSAADTAGMARRKRFSKMVGDDNSNGRWRWRANGW